MSKRFISARFTAAQAMQTPRVFYLCGGNVAVDKVSSVSIASSLLGLHQG